MRSKQGIVISNANDKSIVIRVDREVKHPIYKKNYRASNKFHAHDEKNEAQIGDVVEIAESRPLSKLKRWKLVKIVAKSAKAVVDTPAAVKTEQEKELHAVAGREKEKPAEKKKEEKTEEVEAKAKKPSKSENPSK